MVESNKLNECMHRYRNLQIEPKNDSVNDVKVNDIKASLPRIHHSINKPF